MPAATDRGSPWSNIAITTPTEEYIRIMLIIYPIQPNPSAFVTNHQDSFGLPQKYIKNKLYASIKLFIPSLRKNKKNTKKIRVLISVSTLFLYRVIT